MIVDIKKANVTLKSYPGERATWEGRIVIAAPGVTVQNLNLDGSTGELLDGSPTTPQCAALARGNCTKPSVTINGPDAKIYANNITNHAGICIHTLSYDGLTPDRFDIERNRIHDCKPADNHVHGIYISEGVDGVIKYNVVYDNGDRGIQLYPDGAHATISYNTLDGNRTNLEFGSGCLGSPPVCTTSSNNTVTDNIFSFPSTSSTDPAFNARFNVEAYGGGNQVATRNMVSGNCTYTDATDWFGGMWPASGISGDSGFTARSAQDNAMNIVGNPGYVNRAAHDFTLASGSRCAGKGAPPDVTAPSQGKTSRSGTFGTGRTRPNAHGAARVLQRRCGGRRGHHRRTRKRGGVPLCGHHRR